MKQVKSTICIYHSIDLDGWMSAAIVKKWWNFLNSQDFMKDAIIDLVGWNYGESEINVSNYDRVIMCDVVFSYDTMFNLRKKFGHDNENPKFIWLDHHISAIREIDRSENFIKPKINGIRLDMYSACELTWNYFFCGLEMPKIVEYIGMYDSHRYVNSNEVQRVLDIQYGARTFITDVESALKNLNDDHSVNVLRSNGKVIYKYAAMIANEIYKSGSKIRIKHKLEFSKTVYYDFYAINSRMFNPIDFGFNHDNEGYQGYASFWFEHGRWYVYLYNEESTLDCSSIAKQFGGGGHAGAAGFIVNNSKFSEIVKMFK